MKLYYDMVSSPGTQPRSRRQLACSCRHTRKTQLSGCVRSHVVQRLQPSLSGFLKNKMTMKQNINNVLWSFDILKINTQHEGQKGIWCSVQCNIFTLYVK